MKTKLAEIIIREMEGECQTFIESIKEQMEGVLVFEKAPRPFICVCNEKPETLFVSLFEHDAGDEFNVTVDDLVEWEDGVHERKTALAFYRKVVERFEKEVEEDEKEN